MAELLKPIEVGEYDTPDRFYATLDARYFFLYRAGSLVPELLESLATSIEPLPPGIFHRSHRELYRLFFLAHEKLDPALLVQIAAALGPWQERWHLKDEWVRWELVDALSGPDRHPIKPYYEIRGDDEGGSKYDSSRRRTATELVQAAWSWFAPCEPGAPIQDDAGPQLKWFDFGAAWYPHRESWTTFSRWVKERFEAELRAYRDYTDHEMEQEGFVRNDRKTAPPELHFDWLVHYQVQGWSYQKIATQYRKSRKAVEGAVKDTAQLIGLTLRAPGRGGRPRQPRLAPAAPPKAEVAAEVSDTQRLLAEERERYRQRQAKRQAKK